MRSLALLMSAAFLASCATTSKAANTPEESAAGGYRPVPISPEAAAIFSRAQQQGPGGSLVLDIEVLRELGFVSSSDPKDHLLLDLAIAFLPALANEMGGEAAKVNAAVTLLGLLRDWADWPVARRFGVIIPGSLAQLSPGGVLDEGLVVLAVDQHERANADLLRGMAALIRAGGGPAIKSQGSMVCTEGEELPDRLCAKAGAGYLALGGSRALARLTAPSGGASLPTDSGPFLQLRADMPGMGVGQLLIDGHSSLTVSVALQAENPIMAQQLEAALNEGLRKFDELMASHRAQVRPALEASRQALAADPDAPATLKEVAAKMTIDQLLDRKGHSAALRRSIKISREEGSLKAELTVSAEVVKESSHLGGMGVAMAAAGIGAAIAIPNFIGYQCKSKQSEAKANLKAAYTAQRAYFAEKDKLGKTLEEVGFSPEAGRYTYCMNGQCLPCARAGCKPPEPSKNPCLEMVAPQEPPVLKVCAVADLGDGKLDVWSIEQNGVPENVRDGCR